MFFNVEDCFRKIKKKLHNADDLCDRIFIKNKKIGIIFLKSMIDEKILIDSIIIPMDTINTIPTIKLLKTQVVKGSNIEEIKQKDIVNKILLGYVIIAIENEESFLAIDLQDYPMRMPSEPPTSPVIRGPREGFTEDIKTNITLIRRRFYTKDLVFKHMKVGKYSQTDVAISYIDGIANKEVVKKIEKKIKGIDIDGIIDTFYIGKFLEEKPYSLFKQVGNTEKPDIACAKMLEGRVAILVDGSPIVITLPFIALEDLQSSNDYYTNSHYATLIRYVRLIGFIFAVMSSGVYLALRLFHFNVMPTKFLITIAETTQAIPFTPFVELLFITLLFQILYEVSLRLPSYLGLATSIVGALILGETGVNAGLISPPGVIVIALSKIAVYTMPEEAPQITVLQLIFLILGGSLGLLGIIGGMIYLISYLSTFNSYGSAYLAPYGPRVNSDLKDGLNKSPIVDMKLRPKSFKTENKVRMEK